MNKKNRNLCYIGALSTALFSASTFAAYDGTGGVDDGSAISASELTTNGYQFPNELVSSASHTQLANHAWRLFIAANQPTTATLTNGTGRATPDQNKSFADTGSYAPQSNPTVWESFYHRAEAFPYIPASGGAAPSNPLNKPPTYYYYEEVNGGNNGRKAPQNVISNGQYVNLDENNQVSQNMLYYNHGTDPNFPVLFMAKVNDVELNYVWDRPFAPASASLSFPHPEVNGPQASTVSTIEVKSAWRRVSDIQPASIRDNFHQANATYYVGDEENYTQVNEPFALIGLHIIQKTDNYQTFIFSTFEHVDSVTTNADGDIIDPNIDLSYNTLAYGADSPSQTNAYGAYSKNLPGQPSANNVRTDHTLPPAGPVTGDRYPVERLKTISKEVNDVNNQVAALIPANSVWKNYRLKGVQAVPSSYPVNNGTVPQDYYLANIVVESSQPGLQLFTGTVQNPTPTNLTFTNNRALPQPANLNAPAGPNVSPGPVGGQPVEAAQWTMGGCMGCHGNAQQAGQDMSFLGFGLGGNGFFVDPVASPELKTTQKEAHYDQLMLKKGQALKNSLK
jgi:hypothetical protein